MGTARESSVNDRLFCWEQVNRTNRAFKISQVFAAREDAAKLLPLYALFSVVEQICSVPSDEDLAHSKLQWWRAECGGENMMSSHHPVLRELRRTGAAQSLGDDVVRSLLDSAAFRLEASAPADISELRAICLDIQKPQFGLEMKVVGLGEDPPQIDSGTAARGGLLQLIRESANRTQRGAYWWIPLNMLARYGIGRDVLVSAPDSPEVSGLLTELIEESLSWVSSENTAANAGRHFPSLRNYFAINGIYHSKIRSLKGLAADRYKVELGCLRITDLVAAWTCARRQRC